MEMDQRVEQVSYARVEVNKGTRTAGFGMNAVCILYVRTERNDDEQRDDLVLNYTYTNCQGTLSQHPIKEFFGWRNTL
jgi:hypothetical protein